MRNAIKVIKHIFLFIVLWWGIVSSVFVLGLFTSFLLLVPEALLLFFLFPFLALVFTFAPSFVDKMPDSTYKIVFARTVKALIIIFILFAVLGSYELPYSLNAPR